eukprot:TRINITY_DN10967_c0_g1_i1.p1 TRINITY_DN10967_c0_g1~~TRINITY_DN10967_c0_g1_i1.p1  ORF type:complete len:212 (-),score=12.21 TRINITY_DN10967_c0_g1_i1:345-980(-)
MEDEELRRKGVQFIQEAGIKLEYPETTTATAAILFHNFYHKRSFKDFDKHLIVMSCLYLAAKLEESPKKLRDVISTAYNIQHRKTILIDNTYWELRDKVVAHEHILLRTIGFDLSVKRPQKYLLNYLKSMKASTELTQVSWNILNDSLETRVWIDYSPQTVAVAVIYLASKFLRYEMPQTPHVAWYQVFDVTLAQIQPIVNEILHVYETAV